MKRYFLLILFLLLYSQRVFAATPAQLTDVSFCSVFSQLAFKYIVLPRGSCYICTPYGCIASHLHNFFVPEAYISVHDRSLNSAFSPWPVAKSQILKEPAAANIVYNSFGKKNLSNPTANRSKLDEEGQNRYFLDVHVGPVFFSQDFFDDLANQYFYNKKVIRPEHDQDGRCIQYSTVFDSFQWRGGSLDRNFMNMSWNIIAASVGSYMLSASQKKLISNYMCNLVNIQGGDYDCEGSGGSVGSVIADLMTVATSSPFFGCTVFDYSLVPTSNTKRDAQMPPNVVAELNTLFAAEKFNGGDRCVPKANVFPIVDANTYCYSKHMIFPRTGYVRANSWFESAYISAVKAYQLASITASFPPFSEDSQICDDKGLLCFLYNTPTVVVDKLFKDHAAYLNSNRVGFVIWKPKSVCKIDEVYEYQVMQEYGEFCAKQAKHISDEFVNQTQGGGSSSGEEGP